jgi:hypothetical protein
MAVLLKWRKILPDDILNLLPFIYYLSSSSSDKEPAEFEDIHPYKAQIAFIDVPSSIPA